MNYLKKMILINSWMGSKITSFDVDGGFVIQGTNGVGKTTTLLLPLCFYGEKPSSIMRSAKNKASFAERYLPKTSSYLVFEYQKNDKTLMVIVYSNDNTSLIYHFCDSAFDESFFVDASGRFVKNADIKESIGRRDIAISRQLSWTEYQEIIQSGKRLDKRDKAASTINHLKATYSMCDVGKSIKGSEKVANAIINSKPSFQTIKELIAQDVLDIGEKVEEQLSKTYNSEHLHKQAEILRQIKRFQEKKPMLSELKAILGRMAEYEHQLKEVRTDAEYALEDAQDNQRIHTERRNQLEIEREKMESDFNEHRNTLSIRKGTLTAELRDTCDRIKNIESLYDQYQADGIAEKQVMVKDLPSYNQRLKEIKGELEALEGTYSEITRYYDELKNGVENRYFSDLDSENKAYNASLSHEKEKQHKLELESKDSDRDIVSTFSERRQSLDAKVSEFKTKLQVLDERRKSATSTELMRLRRDHADLSKGKEALADDKFSVSQQENKCRVDLDSIKDELAKTSKILDRKKREADSLRDEIKSLQEDMGRIDSMFYFKLIEANPAKADLASRCLNLKLLKQPIQDELIELDASLNVLGFDVNVSKLEPQRVLDKDQIINSLQDKEKRLSLTDKDIKEGDERVSTLYGEKVKFETQIDEIKRKQDLLDAKIKDLQAQIESNAKQQDIETKAIALQIDEEASVLNNQVNALIQELKDVDLEKVQDLENNRLRYNEEIKASQDQQNTIIANHNKRLSQLEQDKASQIVEIERKLNQDLTSKGAKTETIEQCRREKNKVSEYIAKAEKSQQEVSKYEAWLESDYGLLDKKKEDVRNFEKQLRSLEQSISTLSRDFNESLGSLKGQLQSELRRLQSADKEINVLKLLLEESLSNITKTDRKVEQAVPAEKLRSKVFEIKHNLGDQDKNGKDVFRSLMASLRGFRELYTLCQDLLTQNGFDELDTQNNWKPLLSSLDVLMSDYLSSHATTLKQEFLAQTQELAGLDGKLDDVAQKINSTGRRISSQFNLDGQKFTNIEWVEANIKAEIEHLPFRDSLRKAAKAFDEVKTLDMEHDDLPENYFEIIARAVKELAQYGKGLDISKFIHVEIRLKNTNSSNVRTAHSEDDLSSISSKGLSFLILVALFVAIKNSIQKNDNTMLAWSIDEMAILGVENIAPLIDMLNRENIAFLCANPSTNESVLGLFKNIYHIQESKGDKPTSVVKIDGTSKLSTLQLFMDSRTNQHE